MIPALAQKLRRQIQETGPITVADYMRQCLQHYYGNASPIGQQGDFITSPEISQMFGELIGLWCADLWQRGGRVTPVHFIELGPGRGTLMADALRALKWVPGILEHVQVHLVEMSMPLQKQQQKILAGHQVTWYETLESALEASQSGVTFVIANEFFDALPIHQYVSHKEQWIERMVDVSQEAFVFTPGIEAPVLREECPAALTMIQAIARHLQSFPGACLTLDYGTFTGEGGDTLQAVKNHTYHDRLKDQGKVDLTAHVNFKAFQNQVVQEKVKSYEPLTQGQFLTDLGIFTRAEQLQKKAEDPKSIEHAVNRLVHEMGELFKVFCFTSLDMPMPAGLRKGE